MSPNKGGVSLTVMLITIGFILAGNFAYSWLQLCEPYLVLGMLLVLGLPHGATDHGLFLALQNKSGTEAKKTGFYVRYFSLIATYALLWYIFPLVAFGVFLLMSVYHFGQSNWVDVEHKNGWLARLHYMVWGTGILFTPILLNAGQAIDIVDYMTGTSLSPLAAGTEYWFIGTLLVVNQFLSLLLWAKGKLTGLRLAKEILGYALLLGVFFNTSLLLGFTVYFVFWHSLSSVKDQWSFFRSRLSGNLRRQLFSGIGMTVGGALVFCLVIWLGPGPEAALSPMVIGGVFVFISLLTLPHILLVEQLYTSWSPTQTMEPSYHSHTTIQASVPERTEF